MPTAHCPELPLRIRRVSRFLDFTCLLLIVALPLMVAIYWSVADPRTLAVRANLSPDAMLSTLLPWQRLAAGFMAEIPPCLLLTGFWHARKCFQLFASGYVFTTNATHCLHRFSSWAMASAIASIICTAVSSVVMTLQNPPGLRYLAIGISSDQVFLLLFAAVVWLMAGIIRQGQVLADENAQFI
jgi:hypothetical protein